MQGVKCGNMDALHFFCVVSVCVNCGNGGKCVNGVRSVKGGGCGKGVKGGKGVRLGGCVKCVNGGKCVICGNGVKSVKGGNGVKGGKGIYCVCGGGAVESEGCGSSAKRPTLTVWSSGGHKVYLGLWAGLSSVLRFYPVKGNFIP